MSSTPPQLGSDLGKEPTPDQPDVEGIGDPDDDGTTYPLEDMMVRPETRTVSEVVRRINNQRYIMNPGFQRDFVWDDKKASKLIESCVMRIPLPVFYVAENPDGRITVVDGLQRLTVFRRFLNDEFSIKLGDNHSLNDLRFSDLPVDVQERVEDTQLTLYILDRRAPDRARLDIFERVNGGVVLTRQQMRNAIYFGPGTRWLERMADHDTFLTATDRTLKRKTMRDREVINRFAAFYMFGYAQYVKGDMDDFLAQAVIAMNRASSTTLDQMENAFISSMTRNFQLFGQHAFRKSLTANSGGRRTPINISLFDVLSTAFTTITDATLSASRSIIRSRLQALVEDERFLNAITYSTNSTRQVNTRFEMTNDALSEYFS